MTAKEMFEELGYKLEESDNIEYVQDTVEFFTIRNGKKVDGSYNRTIKIYTDIKTYIVFDECYYPEEGNIEKDIVEITSEEHKAIHQQMKELGWLE